MEVKGLSLAQKISPANLNDHLMLEELIDSIPPTRGPPGRPRRRPDKLHAEKGYDVRRTRKAGFEVSQGALSDWVGSPVDVPVFAVCTTT